jgi:hypothetical protein
VTQTDRCGSDAGQAHAPGCAQKQALKPARKRGPQSAETFLRISDGPQSCFIRGIRHEGDGLTIVVAQN